MNISSINKYTIAIGATFLSLVCLTYGGWTPGTKLPDLGSLQIEGELPPDLSGKIILLDFWASWCGPCKASFPMLEKLHKDYGPRGLVIIAVNQDENAKDMNNFLKKNPASFTVIRDAAHQIIKQADVQAMPSSFLVDHNGVIIYSHAGFHGEKTAAQYVEEIETLLKAATGNNK